MIRATTLQPLWTALALLVSVPASAAGGYPVPASDRGIFSDLDRRVRLYFPSWLSRSAVYRLRGYSPKAPLLLVDGEPVGYASKAAPAPLATLSLTGARQNDADGDGIPDGLDFLIGAKKAALNRAVYVNSYKRLRYPGGDVPRGEGVCTDVVIRALRNAGFDLQSLLRKDILRARRAYPMVKRPDANIDQRRVRTVLPFFKRHFRRLPVKVDALRSSPLLPGDLVFMNTMGDARPDHLGIISDRLGPSGKPLVINNWTVGYRTQEMDLLGFVPLTHRFRVPRRPWSVKAESRGLDGLLRAHDLKLDVKHRQALVVVAPLWSSSAASLRRYVRGRRGAWRAVGKRLHVRLGSAGLGRGRGLKGGPSVRLLGFPQKKEGDSRSPAGVFALGVAFSRDRRRPYTGRWPWRRVDDRDVFVDDPSSPSYNSWQRRSPTAKPSWRSAESLASYRLGLVVKHNMSPVRPGAGSAIFIHLNGTERGPTVGCTALSRRKDLLSILRWLDPAASPLLIQLPATIF